MSRRSLISIGAVSAIAAFSAAPAFAQSGAVYRVTVTGVVELGLAPYIERSVEEAAAADAAVIVLEMDTPGGRVDAAERISDALSDSPIPVVYARESARVFGGRADRAVHGWDLHASGIRHRCGDPSGRVRAEGARENRLGHAERDASPRRGSGARPGRRRRDGRRGRRDRGDRRGRQAPHAHDRGSGPRSDMRPKSRTSLLSSKSSATRARRSSPPRPTGRSASSASSPTRSSRRSSSHSASSV